ncbi:MAG: PIG-L family deacetylase, partial [Pseudomonadota bacterium]|nr:PIG-L family deacetylase [Pseudomonadota bacterium]
MTLAALLERRPIDEPVALVVAHPDDETLALGGGLHLFRRLLLIHVTDGAPQFLDDAAREGFDSPADYAAARAAELHDALSLVPWAPGADVTRLELHIPDQAATAEIPEIAARLQQAFGAHGIGTAVTHCYEGGHPDHDAVAMAVHRSGVE